MPQHIPKLCRHKRSGRGYVTDPRTGKEIYFPTHWTTSSKHPPAALQAEYEAWLANMLTRREEVPGDLDPAGLTVAELLDSYHAWSLTHYRRGDGRVTSEPANIFHAARFANRIHAAALVTEFGPLKLKQVRQLMIDAGLGRKFINDQVDRLRRAFRWGVENELVPQPVYAALREVRGLGKNRTRAPESKKVRPVPFATVRATLPHLKPRWAALVQVHLYCGMRAEEAVSMRPCDLDRSQVPWLYVPAEHKTDWRDIEREILLGPQARAAIERYVQWDHPDRPVWLCRGRGPHAEKLGPITVSGYRQAIETACLAAKVPVWTPRQLRHTWLTWLKKKHPRGAEAARVIAGHTDLNTTEIYLEADRQLAREVAETLG